jgi:hypothetical protein
MDREAEIKKMADEEERNIIEATMLGDYDPSRTNLIQRCGVCFTETCRTKLRYAYHPEIEGYETATCENCIANYDLTCSDSPSAREFEAITLARLRFHRR